MHRINCDYSLECSKKISGIPDDVRKQFQDVIEKEMAPVGDAKPAICSEDASDDGILYVVHLK